MQLIAGQLPDDPATGVKLRCASCGAEYSARRSDYFMLADNDPVNTCGCGGALILGRETRGRFTPINTTKKHSR